MVKNIEVPINQLDKSVLAKDGGKVCRLDVLLPFICRSLSGLLIIIAIVLVDQE
jgi:hypothetical protein